MRLNFACFRSPTPKHWGQVGTLGTTNVHAQFSVPTDERPGGDSGDLSPLSPEGKTGLGTEIGAIYAGVPAVPAVPTKTIDGNVETQPDGCDPLDALRAPFVAWFDARVWLDAESVALRRSLPRWSTGVPVLHADFVSWLLAQGLAPVTRDQFRSLLEELCCEIRLIYGEEFVSNVALREDVEAQRRFAAVEQEPPEATPAGTVATQSVELPKAQPEDLPALPRGIVLVTWSPKAGPIRLSEYSTVTDVPKFIATTLRQLQDYLEGRTWHAGNWPLSTLLDRLAECGCVVRLEDGRRALQ